jgi:putative SOS response-associated peptidase YedK
MRNLQPHYNVCPTDTIEAVIEREEQRELVPMRWGLVPYWWKKTLKELPATFNARVESVADKPMFRDAYKRRRCIVPASGYYEWTKDVGGKQPHYITAKNSPILPIAGLWENWKDPQSGEVVRSCTLIITNANQAMASIHDRMPVILAPENFSDWLSGKAGLEVLNPAPDEALQSCRVSKRVNKPGNDDDATLIEPLAA